MNQLGKGRLPSGAKARAFDDPGGTAEAVPYPNDLEIAFQNSSTGMTQRLLLPPNVQTTPLLMRKWCSQVPDMRVGI